jgi:hypothetical protein
MRSVSERLNRHFAACAAAAVAATAVTSGGAEAAIVYSGIKNIAIPATTDGVYLNLITGANGATPSSAPGWQINPWGTTGLRFGTNYPVPDAYYVGNGGNSSGGTAVNLAVGSTISFDGATVNNPSSMSAAYKWSYSASSVVFGAAVGQWKTNAINYVGLLSLEGDGSVIKAWMRISVGATFATRTIVDWAYEINGGALTVGAVPAPGAAALLALAGVMGRRRRV